MQVDANFVNDYFDFVKGVDTEERLGPERACAQGWIELEAMKRGIILTTTIACLVGLPLIYFGGWTMILIGLACVVFCFLYTTILSRLGMGDLLVLVFFGIVPVCATFYLMTGKLDWNVVMYSIAMGLVTDNLLIVNNYRDREVDAKVGKKTLIVAIGEKATMLYLLLGFIATALVFFIYVKQNESWKVLLLLPYIFLHIKNYQKMVLIHHGKALNKVLGSTSAAIFLFAILLSLGIVL